MSDDYTRGLKPFKPGETGNPGGKPAGARNRLTARFLNDLAAHYEEHGVDAIDRLCADDPAGYVKVVAALCPKEIEMKSPLQELKDDELLTAVRALESFLAARPVAEGTGATRQ
jgi:hypothetical protein